MNAMMRINVRVTSTSAARQIRQLTREMRAFTAATAAANGAGMLFGGSMLRRGIHNLEKYGKNLQWAGRQIEFSFTLPILLAGAAATKFAFEAEASFIRLQKVYQDAPDGIYTLQEELDLLRQGFRLLSDEFGVHLDEVNEIGAAWAQAGASGVALAKATRMTLEAMILGDLESADATEALIAIQGQYELSSRDMQQALADLNKISNITTAGFSDLIEALQRGGGIARQAGVTIREFAAMTASLVPAAGNARRAGTSLRTIISRMMAPTSAATDLFRELGLQVDDSSWHSMNFTERLMELKDGLNGVSASQRNMALSVIGSRWQVARLAVLMSDLNNENGRYATALEGTATAQDSMNTYWEELEIFLTSTPQGFKILTNQIRNLGIDIVQQVLPALLGLMTHIRDLIKRFTDLSPRIQQIVLASLLFVAVLGTMTRLVGASVVMFVQFAKVFRIAASAVGFVSHVMLTLFVGDAAKKSIKALKHISGALLLVRSAFIIAIQSLFSFALWKKLAGRLIAAGASLVAFFKGAGFLGAFAKIGAAIWSVLLGPVGIAIAAVVVLLAAFWDEISAFVDRINNKWGSIPKAIMSAMRAAVDVVRRALEAIGRMFRQFFGITNESPRPPSGAQAPARPGGPQEYARGGEVPGEGDGDTVPALLTPGEFVMSKKAVEKYGVAAFEAMNALRFQSGGQVPGALVNFLRATQGARTAMRAAEVAEKRSIVLEFAPGAGSEFDALIASIEQYTRRQEQLSQAIMRQESVVAAWQRKLDAANLTLDKANNRLTVLRDRANAVSNALTDAQTRLDDLINTPIEGMKEYSDALFENEMAQKALRLEILKMEEAGESVDDLRERMSKLSGEIEMLRGDREELRLAGEGSDVLGFYDDQIAGLEAQREALMGSGGAQDSGIADLQQQLEDLQREAEMLRLEESIKFDPMRRQIEEVTNSMKEMPFDELLEKIIAQQGEVARLTEKHNEANDAVSQQEKVVDRLTAARDRVQQSYDAEKAQLDSLKDSYSIVTDQIRQMESALADFVSQANSAKSAAEAAAAGDDVSKYVEDFRGAEGDFDIPGGTGDIGFEEGDLKKLIDEWGEDISESLGNFDLFGPMVKKIKDAWNSVMKFFSDLGLVDLVKGMFSGLGDWLGRQIDGWVGNFDPFINAWHDIQDVLSAWNEKIRETFGGDAADGVRAVGKVFSWVGSIIFDSVNLVTQVLTGAFALVWPTLRHIIEQFGNAVIEVFGGLAEFVTGFIDWFGAFFTGKWSEAGEAALRIIRGLWDAIYGLFRGAVAIVAGIVMGIVEGIADFFTWLYDVLVGNSIIPDLIDAIFGLFRSLWEFAKKIWKKIVGTIVEFVVGLKDKIVNIVKNIHAWLKKRWTLIKTVALKAWNLLKDGVRDKVVWLRDRIKNIVNNIKDWLGTRWNNIKNNALAAWNLLKDGVRDKVVWLRDRIRAIIEGIRTWMSGKWNSIKNKALGVWDTIKSKLRDKVNDIKGIFRGAVRTIGNIWSGIKSKIKAPIKWVYNNVISKLVGGFNTIARKVPGLPTIALPEFHEGGVVGEGGGAYRDLAKRPLTPDEQLAVLRNGERVLTEEERRLYENDPAYMQPEVGGPFDWAKNIGTSLVNQVRDVMADVAGPMVRQALNLLDYMPGGDSYLGRMMKGLSRRAGNALLQWIDTADDKMPKAPALSGGIGWKAMWDALSSALPFARLTSGYRPGAITATGNPSYHGMGRAIDVAGRGFMNTGDMAKISQWIADNYASQTRELIYSGPGGKQLHNGSPHFYSGITRAMHYDHVHWAMDNGGLLQPGWNQPIYNGTGRPEIVTPEPMMRGAFRAEVSRLEPLGGGDRTVNINGDLSFPNIKSGEDADDFIRNLENMAN